VKKRDEKQTTGLEENLKKALTELLVLFLFSEGEHYIGELPELLRIRSQGSVDVMFPYSVIYRTTEAGYLEDAKKRVAPDGRRRQYYKLTEKGLVYLKELLEIYRSFCEGIDKILFGDESHG
jgi:PadR family transcriptional regulator PadR